MRSFQPVALQDYELVEVNSEEKEHKTPKHLSKQPFGLVPYLEDGDLTLFGKHGWPLLHSLANYMQDPLQFHCHDGN